jgi:hypothetical protein
VSLRGKVAVVGVAEADLGEVGPGFTPLDLIGQATLRALEDSGLDKSDVDGLFSASAYYHMPTLSVGEYLGIRPRYSDATSMGGSSFVSHLLHAAAAIDAGLCEVASSQARRPTPTRPLTIPATPSACTPFAASPIPDAESRPPRLRERSERCYSRHEVDKLKRRLSRGRALFASSRAGSRRGRLST